MAEPSDKKDQPSPPEKKVVNLKTHPLVDKLMPPGGSPPNLVPLTGYIGPSQNPDNVRLYTGLDFSSYYEIPKSAVAHTEQADAEDENSPTTVYVHGSAQIDLVQTTTTSVEASFLQGSIASDNLGTAAASAAGVGAAAQPTPTALPTFICSAQVPQCRPSLPRPICTEVISVCGPCVTRNRPICTEVISVCGPCVTGNRPICTEVISVCGICPTRTVINTACVGCVTVAQINSVCAPCLTNLAVCSQNTICCIAGGGAVIDPQAALAAQAQAAGGGAAAGQQAALQPSLAVVCATSPVVCQATVPVACTHIGLCPTSPVICTETIVPTRQFICPTRVGICPSSPIICTETIVPTRQFICPTRPIICTETIPGPTTFCPTPGSIACTPPIGGGGGFFGA
jgi:hypothetical protein